MDNQRQVQVVSVDADWSGVAGGWAAVVRWSYVDRPGRVYRRYGRYYRSPDAARAAAAFMADQVRGMAD